MTSFYNIFQRFQHILYINSKYFCQQVVLQRVGCLQWQCSRALGISPLRNYAHDILNRSRANQVSSKIFQTNRPSFTVKKITLKNDILRTDNCNGWNFLLYILFCCNNQWIGNLLYYNKTKIGLFVSKLNRLILDCCFEIIYKSNIFLRFFIVQPNK